MKKKRLKIKMALSVRYLKARAMIRERFAVKSTFPGAVPEIPVSDIGWL